MSNLRKAEHILGGGLNAKGDYVEDIILRPGCAVELTDEQFKRHDSAALRAMVAAGDLALGEVSLPKKPEPVKTSNAVAISPEVEAETAELLKNVSKSRK